MIEFMQPLDVEYIDGKNWRLIEEFTFCSSDAIIIVPKGFVTDFASIPRAFWIILPPTGPMYGKAAVVHDYMYVVGQHENYTKAQADRTFLEGMTLLGVPVWKRSIMYKAVCRFGRGKNFA